MKRSGFIKRRTSLRRGPWRRGKRAKSSYRRRERFVDYMLWVKTLPCMVSQIGIAFAPSGEVLIVQLRSPRADCYGEVQADHAGRRAFGRKAHDNTCIPLCREHHDERTMGHGAFRGLTLEQKREWNAFAIKTTWDAAREQNVDIPQEGYTWR